MAMESALEASHHPEPDMKRLLVPVAAWLEAYHDTLRGRVLDKKASQSNYTCGQAYRAAVPGLSGSKAYAPFNAERWNFWHKRLNELTRNNAYSAIIARAVEKMEQIPFAFGEDSDGELVATPGTESECSLVSSDFVE